MCDIQIGLTGTLLFRVTDVERNRYSLVDEATPEYRRVGWFEVAKMVSFKVSFWTNNMKEDGGYIRRKCWNHGVVHLLRNEDHGIEKDKEMFHRISDVPEVMKTLGKRNGIEFRLGRYSKPAKEW